MDRGLTRRELGRITLGGAALAGLGSAGVLAGCGSGGAGPDESAKAVLDRLPKTGVPKPVDFIRTNWSKDPLAYCSYSYLPPNPLGSGIRRLLAEPAGRVAFAGEATGDIPATVHGAAQSGRDAGLFAADELRSGSRVAIVGAGAAGLACAGALLENGMEPFILEASDRVGGRVRSGELTGSPVELGASWIHGVDGNPLTELAGEAGIDLHPFAYELDFPVPGQGALGRAGERRFRRAINSFEPYASGANQQTVDWLLPWQWGPGLEWAVQTEVQQEYGGDPGQVAALATWEGEWFPGGDALLDGAYVDVISGLSGDAEIRFGAKVRRIDQDSNSVRLVWDGGEAEADAVVVTVPIGVLKAGVIEFRPALPARTLAAIEGLGAGLLDKLWLAFEEPFWEEDTEGFSWINPRLPGRWGSWVNAVPVTGKPFLMTLSGGSDAHRLSGWSDLDLIADAMGALDAMFG